MILRDIRDRIWAQADYAPAGSPEGVVRTREFINRALMRLVQDAPFLFEEEVTFWLDPDLLRDEDNAVSDDWQSVSPYDPWVLQSVWTSGSAPDLFARFTDPDRPYNGWWLEYRDPADASNQRIQRHRIRNIDIIGEGDNQQVTMTLFEPVMYDSPGFLPTGSGGVGVINDWRITMVQHALPADVVSIEAVQVYDSLDNFIDFRYMTAHEAVRHGYDAAYWTAPTASHPWVCWPGEIETFPAKVPTAAPYVYADSVNTWGTTGDDIPRGKFEYRYTLSLGHRHDENQDYNPTTATTLAANASGRRLPYIESPPTAHSAVLDPDDKTIKVQTPDFNLMYGFRSSARLGNTGFFVNVYRRRVENGTPPGGQIYDGWPVSNHFYHVHTAEVDNTGFLLWEDDGSYLNGRILKHQSAYKTLRFSPTSDKRYRVHVRAVVRPDEMLDDSDTCNIPPSAMDALIFLALRNLYEASGNPSMAASSFRDYERALHALKKRHASLKASGESWKMRPRSSRRKRAIYRHYQVVDAP